ncbi:fused MFS/spermidine synthase, partial [Candidatus Sumerlaeota bacterium]|nr:fused MFS/spermidine synthase [Candidatus Sumerlaeota bacterium]
MNEESIKSVREIPAKDARLKFIRTIVFLLFFGSGISGLVYEVVWTRQLTYLFGATLFAVATVLSAFMGGMALGSYLFGKWADRYPNNLKIFGMLQIGIGVSGLLLPFILSFMDPIYRTVYRNFDASFFVLSLIRFILTFLVLLIPSTLMGGTLPVLSRFMVKENKSLGLNVGALYSLNTLGAVLGCFLTGFVFIAALGVRGSTIVAVGVNCLVGIVSILLASGVKPTVPDKKENKTDENTQIKDIPVQEDAASSRKIVHAVLWCYAISGFIALSYQVVWNRALVFTFDVMKNTTYSFTAMLTVFLIGLSLGGMAMSLFVDKQKDCLRLFALIELMIGLFGAFSFFAIFYLGPGISPFDLDEKVATLNWAAGVMNVFAKTIAAIFIPTFLMGMAFPVVTKICVDRIKSVGFGVGRIYSLNTIGAIFGSFASGFILIPILGIAGTIYLLAFGNILIALYLFIINPMLTKNKRTMLYVICILSAVILVARAPRGAQFQEESPTEKMVFYKEGPLATVSVLENSFKYRTLYVDNVGVAGTDRILLTDQKSLAHIPMLLLKNPKSALTVGFGSGGASYSYTRFDAIKDIHCVEICDTVMDSAPDLLASNHGILLPVKRNAPMPLPLKEYATEAYPGYLTFDPRYKIILDDVRSYLRFTGRKYDIIATDCTDLRYKSNANLYDYQYFRLCRERITEEGMVVVWMPLGGLSDEMFRLALRTFYRVFPEMSVWYMNNESTHYIILIGTPKPLKIDYDLLRKKLEVPKVKNDLGELFLDDADKILSCFL